jgi:hypothetical protein
MFLIFNLGKTLIRGILFNDRLEENEFGAISTEKLQKPR